MRNIPHSEGFWKIDRKELSKSSKKLYITAVDPLRNLYLAVDLKDIETSQNTDAKVFFSSRQELLLGFSAQPLIAKGDPWRRYNLRERHSFRIIICC
jgi:hypothetical protein